MLPNRAFGLFVPGLGGVVFSTWFSISVLAQTPREDSKAMALRPNVVKITAKLGQNLGPQTGFGFIVGQQKNRLVIVTADHVVRGDDPGSEDKTPLITFFLNQGSQVRGTLETVGLPKGQGDLAVILVDNPGFATFATEAIDIVQPERGLKMWVIGRAGGWNIPVSPGVVAGTQPFSQRIQVENLAARVGSSGGPLVSSKGIVGMIVDDDGLYTEATRISSIQTQVRDNWGYVWQLTHEAKRPPVGRKAVSDLAPVNDTGAEAPGGIFSCKYENNLKSLTGASSTSLVFRNESGANISLFWLNYEGKRTFYSNVQNGAQYSLATYISHPWVVVDEQGQCLELVLPGKSTATVDIQQ
jgi:hypothetical protein